MNKYEDIIKEVLSNDVLDIQLVSKTSNYVYKVTTNTYGVVYAKFYLNNSSHIDNELYLYELLDKKYLKEIIVSSNNPKYAIFKELKGKTLDELNNEEIENNKGKIIDSLICFYESISKVSTNGYGILDNNLNGTSNSFIEFITNRQTSTQNNLSNYSKLNKIFTLINDKYKDLLTGDNKLVPIDTNAKNIMLTIDGEVKFIDPGELISAPVLMGYGDFVAHTYKTPLYDELISRLNLNEDDMKRLRIYAIFSSLNILSFLKNLGVEDLDEVIPYGNRYTFVSLIEEHLKYLGIEEKKDKVKLNTLFI